MQIRFLANNYIPDWMKTKKIHNAKMKPHIKIPVHKIVSYSIEDIQSKFEHDISRKF